MEDTLPPGMAVGSRNRPWWATGLSGKDVPGRALAPRWQNAGLRVFKRLPREGEKVFGIFGIVDFGCFSNRILEMT